MPRPSFRIVRVRGSVCGTTDGTAASSAMNASMRIGGSFGVIA